MKTFVFIFIFSLPLLTTFVSSCSKHSHYPKCSVRILGV